MKKFVRSLNAQEMQNIEEGFDKAFPGRSTMVLHEKKSRGIHVDLEIMQPETCDDTSYVIYTLGMSNTLMPNGTRCEIFLKVDKEMFNVDINDAIGTVSSDTINPNYFYLLDDLISIARMPFDDRDDYNNLETIMTGDNYYALNEIFTIENPVAKKSTKIFYLVPLSEDDVKEYNTIEDSEEKVRFLNERMEPIKDETE